MRCPNLSPIISFMAHRFSLHLQFSKPKKMKKSLLLLLIITGIMACNTADKNAETSKLNATDSSAAKLTPEDFQKIQNDTTGFTTIEWLDAVPLDLGNIKAGEVREVVFRFKNTGTKPLVITDVRAGCGCTDPQKPEGAVAPGEQGEVKAKFNSKGFKGLASKVITVTANTNPSTTHELNFKAQVID